MRTAERVAVIALLSIVAHAVLLALLPDDGSWIEAIYARRVYPVVGTLVAYLPGRLPFSLAAVALLVALVWMPALFALNCYRWRRGRLDLRGAAGRTLAGYALVAAVAFHGFYAFWGYNYLRPPIETRLGLAPTGFAPAERGETARQIVAAAVASRVEVPPWDPAELDRLVDAALTSALTELEGRAMPVVSPLKADLPRGLIAFMGSRGVISPLTLEPHVDFGLPPGILPFAAAHEKAHVAGFAAERDANFVAWFALTRADDARLRHAGYLGVVNYFLNDETRVLAEPLRADLDRLRAYRARTASPVAERGGRSAYRVYLRANRVEAGLDDYAGVARLIHSWLAVGNRAIDRAR